MNYPIYLDYNATTPCAPEVVDAMMPFFSQHFGNPASKNHPYGWIAENGVEMAREKLAALIGARPKEIVFTSGATEAINLAIKGIFEHYIDEKQHFISCQTEHKAVLDTLESIQERGAEITLLPVDSQGQIDLTELESSIRPNTKMIALMWANNETGVVHPIDKIAKIAEKHHVVFFTDAVQAVGKLPINVSGIHLLALSSHKIYGPKGVGALYIRHNHEIPKPVSQIIGGGHEKGFRSGTLNVPAIVGLGKAAELASNQFKQRFDTIEKLRDHLEKGILEIDGTILNSGQTNRVNNVSNISFQGFEGEDLLRELSREVAVSSGSACSSISPKPSHVLAAMGIDSDLARASVRFSIGKTTTKEEVDSVISIVKEVVERLK